MDQSEEDEAEEKKLRASLLEFAKSELREARGGKPPPPKMRWFEPCIPLGLIAIFFWLRSFVVEQTDPLYTVATVCGFAGLIAIAWLLVRHLREPTHADLLEGIIVDLESGAPLSEESTISVECDDWGVRVSERGVPKDSCSWAELSRVVIVASDPDLWMEDRPVWVLFGGDGEVKCVVPSWANGERLLSKRLWALPGFDERAGFEGTVASARGQFLCWDRRTAKGSA